MQIVLLIPIEAAERAVSKAALMAAVRVLEMAEFAAVAAAQVLAAAVAPVPSAFA